MTDFIFDLATPDDDAAIRRLLATNPVPGDVTVTYEREPSYFHGCATMGDYVDVIVCRHTPTGGVAGLGVRTSRLLYVNGQPERVAYLSQLRADQQFRGTWQIARGYKFAKQLHDADPTAGTITTIIDTNERAKALLVDKARRTIPAYREVGLIRVMAIVLRRTRSQPDNNVTLRDATPDDLPDIVAFLNREGARKQFFPVWHVDDFHTDATRGFAVTDFLLACRGADLVGVVGLWNQSSFKQTVVQGYGRALKLARPFYNLRARLLGANPLPDPGEAVRQIYASFVCVTDDNPAVFASLLRGVYNRAAERGFGYLIIGLHHQDPLLRVAERYPYVNYDTRLYTVQWAGGEPFHDRLIGRLPYLELATL